MALLADRESVLSAISALGYKCFKRGKFHWNSSETPDSSVNLNGTVHRWTDGWHGDLIDFIREVKNVPFIEAKRLAEELIGAESNSNSFEAWKPEEKKSLPIDKSFLLKFQQDRKRFFKPYMELLRQLLPSVADTATLRKIALKYHIGYIKQSHRLHIPIFDLDGSWVTTAKYSPNAGVALPKILFSKGRAKIPFNLQNLRSYKKDKPLLILEGHKDVLNGVANGYQCVTPGGAGDLFRDKDLSLFANFKKVIIVGDNDDAGTKFNKRIKSQLSNINNNIVVWDWDLLSIQSGKTFKKGYDFTDWLVKKNKE